MKAMIFCAAAAVALATTQPAAAQAGKPRFPVRREAAAAAPPPVQAPAPVATAVEAEGAPVAAPTGAVQGAALPALSPAPSESEPVPTAAPERAPVLTLAAAATAVQGTSAQSPVYTMQSGDTLTGVGRRFKTTVAKLRELNGLSVDASIKAGQKIRLPDGATDTGTEPFAKGPAPVSVAFAKKPEPAVRRAEAPPAAPPPVIRKPVVIAEASPPPAVVSPLPAVVAPPPAAVATPGLAAATPAVTPRTEIPPVQTPTVAAATPKPVPPPVAAPAPAATAVTTTAAAAAVPTPTLDAAAAGKGRFVWPVRGEVISGFGPKGPGQRNDGLNIAAQEGEPVQAAAAGEVVYAGDQVPGFGKLVLIKHDGGWVTAYAHLSEIGVKMKDRVAQGGPIGKAGRTGAVSSPQLHFEVRYAPTTKDKARPVDPMPLLPQ